jgi:DNA-binding PadR family transcriptional regulator
MANIRPLAVAVMGLLAEAPRHPYDIACTMRKRHMHEHIKLTAGTLYHVVEQLGRLGWIRPTETAREGRWPERTTYEVTQEGGRQLRDRTGQLIAEPIREYSAFEAGLAFMHQLPREEAVALLRRRADALREQVELGDRVLDRYRAGSLSRLALVEAELVQDTRRFQREWALRIAGEIESGALAWDCRATCTDAGRDAEPSRLAQEVSP